MANAARSALLGYNHNLRYRGCIYHVQTEDSGPTNPHVSTHLFHEGTIFASKRRDYDSDLPEENVRAIMKDQHRAILRELKQGLYDERLAGFVASEGEAPAPTDEAALPVVEFDVAPVEAVVEAVALDLDLLPDPTGHTPPPEPPPTEAPSSAAPGYYTVKRPTRERPILDAPRGDAGRGPVRRPTPPPMQPPRPRDSTPAVAAQRSATSFATKKKTVERVGQPPKISPSPSPSPPQSRETVQGMAPGSTYSSSSEQLPEVVFDSDASRAPAAGARPTPPAARPPSVPPRSSPTARPPSVPPRAPPFPPAASRPPFPPRPTPTPGAARQDPGAVVVQRQVVVGVGAAPSAMGARPRRPVPPVPYVVKEGSHASATSQRPPTSPPRASPVPKTAIPVVPPRPLAPPVATSTNAPLTATAGGTQARPAFVPPQAAPSDLISDKSLDEVILAYLSQGEAEGEGK